MTAIEEYLSQVPAPERAELERIRRIVMLAAPDATETMSYGMPGYKFKNKPLIWYAAFRDHMSIFPTAGPIDALKIELASFKLSKGTVQFTLANPIPEELLVDILRHRMAEIISG